MTITIDILFKVFFMGGVGVIGFFLRQFYLKVDSIEKTLNAIMLSNALNEKDIKGLSDLKIDLKTVSDEIIRIQSHIKHCPLKKASE